ncbi:hypothetical protein H6B10_16755, partial [Gemmiger formicilis]|nr:hypothetical protein [Gemmiger formicilis]
RPQGWEDLTDEELVTFCRGRYEECSAPAGLYCIEGDGAIRQGNPIPGGIAHRRVRDTIAVQGRSVAPAHHHVAQV